MVGYCLSVGVKGSWSNIGGSYRWTPVVQGDLPQCELAGPFPPSLGCSQGPDNHWSYKTRFREALTSGKSRLVTSNAEVCSPRPQITKSQVWSVLRRVEAKDDNRTWVPVRRYPVTFQATLCKLASV